MSDTRAELTLRDYGRVVWRRRWLVLMSVALAVLVAVGLTSLQTSIYSASADVLVQPRGQDGLFENQIVNLNERAIQTEIQVIEGEAVRSRVQADLQLTETPPEVAASAVGQTDVIAITVRDANADNAQTVANAYAEAYIAVRREQSVNALLAASVEVQGAIDDLEEQIDALPDDDPSRTALVSQLGNFNATLDELRVDAALRTGGATIIKPAELPTSPVEPTPARTAVLAAVVGLLIGLGAAFLFDHLDDKVRTEEDLEVATGRPVLAVVPVDPPPDHRPIALSEPGHVSVEAYRGLRTNLQFLGLDRPIRVVQLTSSMAGEGKTTTSVNLAIVLAQAGHRVALLDNDLRRPRIHEMFGIPQTPGFTDLLLGTVAKDVVNKIDVHVEGSHQLSVYTSGAVPSNPSELLSGRRVQKLLTEMGAFYDFVIIDSAPILPVSDSVALAAAVDGVLVVAQADRVTDDDVNDTVERLERVGAPILGMVLNRANRAAKDSYAYGGYLQTPATAAATTTPDTTTPDTTTPDTTTPDTTTPDTTTKATATPHMNGAGPFTSTAAVDPADTAADA